MRFLLTILRLLKTIERSVVHADSTQVSRLRRLLSVWVAQLILLILPSLATHRLAVVTLLHQ